MVSSSLQQQLQPFISESLGVRISSMHFSSVGGGSINEAYELIINKKDKFFCKINSADAFPQMFAKEKKGLELLAAQGVIRVPQAFASIILSDRQLLILEWIEQGIKSDRFWKLFGEQLAALHAITANYCGLNEDNYMGALPQSNEPSGDWVHFFIQQRLLPQIELATTKNLLDGQHQKKFENLFKSLPSIFPDEKFSLVHGDLWSGNYLCNHSGQPVLIDPAVYYGHRSMDLAMTTLFGGFDPGFYKTYHYHAPFPSNHQQQWDICNLYPLLIHLNLFGAGYLRDINHIIQYY